MQGVTRRKTRAITTSVLIAASTSLLPLRADAEPVEPPGQTESAVSVGLPPVVHELLELRLAAQKAITDAELARVSGERARVRATAARFAATVARLRARHAQHQLERWAASLYRNEIGISAATEIAQTGILDPERVLDVSLWLELSGRSRKQIIAEAETLRSRAESLERLTLDSLARAQQAERYAQERRAEADLILATTETALRAAVGDGFRHQLTIGPDGCPTSSPANTLRGGLAAAEVAVLCARSVALAPTPEAALAIKYAFRSLGADYACNGIGRGFPMRYDCSSLVARSYSEGAGLLTATSTWIPTTRNLLPWDGVPQAPWSRTIEPEEALPGDLVLYDTERLASRHVVMVLADGYMLHVAECGDISHVTSFWGYKDGDGYRYLGTRRVDPVLARDPSLLVDGGDPWVTDGVATDEADVALSGDLPVASAPPPVTGDPDRSARTTNVGALSPTRTGPETWHYTGDVEQMRRIGRHIDRVGGR